jgi:hypothetical protein
VKRAQDEVPVPIVLRAEAIAIENPSEACLLLERFQVNEMSHAGVLHASQFSAPLHAAKCIMLKQKSPSISEDKRTY